MKISIIETIKWVGALFLFFGTLLLLNPTIAASSPIPWIILALGNLLWIFDSVRIKSWPWVFIGICFIILDCIIITSRIIEIELVNYISPIFEPLEKLL